MKVWKNFKGWILERTGMQALLKRSEATIGYTNDAINAITFSRILNNIEWLKRNDFYPGMAAIDNTFILHLLRILENVKFNNLLEFGLGQSSKMIHQYANHFNIPALTIEGNQEWFNFFKNDIKEDIKINVQIVPEEITSYKGFQTRTYTNIEDILRNQKFDFILVDGPAGSQHYSRSQIINLAEHNLTKDFCIMIDDCERIGEQETLNEVLTILSQKNIPYTHTIYTGTKKHATICSEKYKFLTTI